MPFRVELDGRAADDDEFPAGFPENTGYEPGELQGFLEQVFGSLNILQG